MMTVVIESVAFHTKWPISWNESFTFFLNYHNFIIDSVNIGSYDDSHFNDINFCLENWCRCSGCRRRTLIFSELKHKLLFSSISYFFVWHSSVTYFFLYFRSSPKTHAKMNQSKLPSENLETREGGQFGVNFGRNFDYWKYPNNFNYFGIFLKSYRRFNYLDTIFFFFETKRIFGLNYTFYFEGYHKGIPLMGNLQYYTSKKSEC